MPSRLARARVWPRRPAPSPRVPRSLAGSSLWAWTRSAAHRRAVSGPRRPPGPRLRAGAGAPRKGAPPVETWKWQGAKGPCRRRSGCEASAKHPLRTRVPGPHRRTWPSPPGRSRRSGAPGGRETRRPRHGPVAGHVSGTSPLMPAFHAVGCATPGGGALTRWCVARGGGAARGAGWPGARAHGASPVRAAPDRRPADPRPRAVPVR